MTEMRQCEKTCCQLLPTNTVDPADPAAKRGKVRFCAEGLSEAQSQITTGQNVSEDEGRRCAAAAAHQQGQRQR